MTRRDRDRSGPGALMLWLVGGAALGLGVASLPSIGMLVLPGAVLILGAAGIVTRGRGWPLVLAGAALPLLWVAWLHRRGPGWVTYETDTGGGGSELLDPVPWLLTGLGLLILAGGLLFFTRWLQTRRMSQKDRAETARQVGRRKLTGALHSLEKLLGRHDQPHS